jgi:site-specific recombinase XerD
MQLNENGIDVKSISRKLSAVKGFFRYCYFSNYIEKNPAASITIRSPEENFRRQHP